MFRHRQQRRRWAARMLVMWLLGIGVAVAHACLAPNGVGRSEHALAPSAAAEVSNVEAGADSGAPLHQAHEDRNAHHPEHRGQTVNPNCEDFCDKAAVSIAPLKSALDQVQGLALPPSAASTAAPVVPVRWVQSWVPRRDGVWAPPIPISFLRLVL